MKPTFVSYAGKSPHLIQLNQMESLSSPAVSSRLARVLPALGCSLLFGLSTLDGATIAAQWNFNDPGNATTSVSSIGGVVGTFNGVATRTPGGGGVSGVAADYALDVGGTNGAMTANDPATIAALNAITAGQAISISYWQFLDSAPNSTAFWGTSTSAPGNRGLNAHSPWGDGNVYFDTSGCCDNPATRISGALGATIGVWQHMSFTYDAGIKTIYRDNTVIASNAVAANPLLTDFTAFIIGNDMAMTALGMDAKLDNFTVWIGALTPAEVAALSIRPVPEPTVALLGALGLVGVCIRRRR
jgi:Concanavalin A-like lectin/glucanases superfamily